MANTVLRRVDEHVYEFCGSRYTCAYCGEPSDTVDHTIPISFVNEKPTIASQFKLIKVAACRECNGLASDKLHRTFSERRQTIRRGLFSRNRRLLETADWPEEELAEMGRGLERMLRAAAAQAAWLRGRLRVLDQAAPPEGVPQDLWEPVRPLEAGEWAGPDYARVIETRRRERQRLAWEAGMRRAAERREAQKREREAAKALATLDSRIAACGEGG